MDTSENASAISIAIFPVKQEVATGTTQKLETMRVKIDRTDTQDN